MARSIIAVILFLFPVLIEAKPAVITGRVVNHVTQEPVAFCDIWIGKQEFHSDEKGFFKFQPDSATNMDSLMIRCIGYHSIVLYGLNYIEDSARFGSIPLIPDNSPPWGCIFCHKWNLICQWKAGRQGRRLIRERNEYIDVLKTENKLAHIVLNNSKYGFVLREEDLTFLVRISE